MNLFGLLLIRKDQKDFMSSRDYNHEHIHTAQYRELGFVLFLPLYLLEWLIKLLYYRFNTKKAYRSISFEREAYFHEKDPDYLKHRHNYAWIRLIILPTA